MAKALINTLAGSALARSPCGKLSWAGTGRGSVGGNGSFLCAAHDVSRSRHLSGSGRDSFGGWRKGVKECEL